MRSTRYLTGLTVLAFALAACGGNNGSVPSGATTSYAHPAARGGAYAYPYQPNVSRACPAIVRDGYAECLALVRTDVGGGPDVSGKTPANLQSAYNLPSASDGSGQTVAVVNAYDDPNAETDLATYRAEFGLPACGSSNACFQKVNEEGQASNYPTANSGWALEESLDEDMVSAICPNCKVVLVEANSNSLLDLGKSVDTAVKIMGASVVSNSYGAPKDKYGIGGRFYHHPGHVIVASAGDSGYKVAMPAGFPFVVAVGGTTLVTSTDSRGWSETVWSGTGSGCVLTRPKPSWQTDKGCHWRTMNDVSADANPSTGVAVYDTYNEGGWIVVGGTSVSSPLVASIYALAGNASSENAAESLYQSGASLFDVTSGSNGTCHRTYLCTAEPGYDGPTGNGTPNGITAF